MFRSAVEQIALLLVVIGVRCNADCSDTPNGCPADVSVLLQAKAEVVAPKTQDECVDSLVPFKCEGAAWSSRCLDDTSGDLCSHPVFGECWSQHCHGQCGCQFVVLSDLGKGTERVAECPAGSVVERCEKEPNSAHAEATSSVTMCTVTPKSAATFVRAKATCGNITTMHRSGAPPEDSETHEIVSKGLP
mmetsp:Transcript_136537/g.255005  ORF Transcript_136537/g.255005 Transcript_136537/m.255005 type:complete len:190 (+) Transcript_136537:115-684(+)